MDGVAIVNGVRAPLDEAGISVLDPAFTVGWGVFETLTAASGVPDNLTAHLDRLSISCREAWIDFPDRDDLEKEVHRAARRIEGTTSAILAVIDGVMYTHPQDGRILGSTTLQQIVSRAEAIDIPIVWEGPPAAGPWDGLYIASVGRHMAPVTLLDGERLPGWDPVGRRLAALPVR